MVTAMRAAVMSSAAATAAAAVIAAAGPASAAPAAHRARHHRPPTPRQIATAVRRAERSRSLWATVNICNTRRYRNDLGVRGQMPTLGFAADLSMIVRVGYWAGSRHAFMPIQSATATTTLNLGKLSKGLQQAGAVFPFRAHAGRLNARITFVWRRGGQVIGRATRRTTAGHPDADDGSPPHYSAAQCRIR